MKPFIRVEKIMMPLEESGIFFRISTKSFDAPSKLSLFTQALIRHTRIGGSSVVVLLALLAPQVRAT